MTQLRVTAVRLQYYDPRAGQRGSDKFYDTITYQSNGKLGEGILVKRWGRTGSTGQFLLAKRPSRTQAALDAGDIQAEKLAKGYVKTASVSYDFIGPDVLNAVLASADAELKKVAVGAAVEQHRNMEAYGVTSIIEEDILA